MRKKIIKSDNQDSTVNQDPNGLRSGSLRLLVIGSTTAAAFLFVRNEGGMQALHVSAYAVWTALFVLVVGTWHLYKNLRLTQIRLTKTQASLEASTYRFDQLLNNIQDVVWFMSADGQVLHYLSKSFEAVWGMSCESLIGDPGSWIKTIHPEDAELARAKFETLAVNNSFDIKFRILRPDGKTRLICAHVFGDVGADGKLNGICGVSEDITAQMEAETQMIEQRGRMIASSKLAELGVMAGGVAHEINNPLSIIQLYAEELTEIAAGPDVQPATLLNIAQKITVTTDRIAKIIRGLRTFAQETDTDQFEPVPLRNVLEDTISLCAQRFKKHGIELRLALPPESLTLDCRSVQISQVLLNLLNNAHDALHGLPEKWIELSVTEIGGNISIAVMDNGHGVPMELRDKITQPFFTTKEFGKGIGLGLSISKGIIEQHFGSLLLDTESPNTRFVMSLPRVQNLVPIANNG